MRSFLNSNLKLFHTKNKKLSIFLCLIFFSFACSKQRNSEVVYTITGQLSSLDVNSSEKSVSHVMAVSPESSSPLRIIESVASDGTFGLTVEPNRPYLIVFIDSSKTGADMVAGWFKSGDLMLVAPYSSQSGSLDLGVLTIDEESLAISDVEDNEILSRMNISTETAALLAAHNHFVLRYTNPDIDEDGNIDSQNFGMDIHHHLNLKLDSAPLKLDDIKNEFPLASNIGMELLTSKAFVHYPESFDSTLCIDEESSEITEDCSVSADPDEGTTYQASSHALLNLTGFKGFGTIYDHTDDKQLPGSDNSPVKIVFDFGEKSLSFSNVINPSKTTFESNPTLVPFLKITTISERITEIGYQWNKMTEEGWTLASNEEVKLFVSDNGGRIEIKTNTDIESNEVDKEVFFKIPTTASGNIAFFQVNALAGSTLTNYNIAIPFICGISVYYDNKMGSRIYASPALSALRLGSSCQGDDDDNDEGDGGGGDDEE